VTEQVVLPVSPLSYVHLYPAALFRWSRTLAADTHRVASFRVRCHELLDPNVMLPVVTEVILVEKPLMEAKAKISQPDSLWIIVKAGAAIVGDAVLFAVDEKAMEMAVHPSHDQLQDMMKICNGSIGVDKKTTPDQRTNPTQSHLELVNPRVWRVEHARSVSDFLFSHLPRFLADS